MSDECDKDIDIILCCPKGKFYPEKDISVKLSNSFNRELLPDKFEPEIDKTWQVRLTANPKLWNGTKFRLDALNHDATSDNLTWHLGVTSYKDFLGTNWSPNAREYQELGVQDHGNSQAYMSDALGVGALVQTADDHFILLRRSQHCGEAVGLLDIPGGHPEPEELVGKVEASAIEPEKMCPSDVIHEIFESVLREIIDEVNIPREFLTYPQLMGIVRNLTSAGRPGAEFYSRCSLTSTEVLKRYLVGGEEAEESTNIVFVPMVTIDDIQANGDLWHELTPSARGCITMYQLSEVRTSC